MLLSLLMRIIRNNIFRTIEVVSKESGQTKDGKMLTNFS